MSFEIAGVSAGATAIQTMTGPSATAPARQKMSSLFDQIDTAGNGSITNAQFAQAFQTMNPPPGFQAMGADAVYSQLDPQKTGSVSRSDFVNTMSMLSTSLRSASGATTVAPGASQPSVGAGTYVNTSA